MKSSYSVADPRHWRTDDPALAVHREERRGKAARSGRGASRFRFGDGTEAEKIVGLGLVELRGIEPLTSAVRLQRSPI